MLRRLQSLGSCAVAFSAGVDSTVVAQAAHLALGDQAVAITAVSPSLASGELQQARELAALIGIRHQEVATQEMQRTGYVENSPERCYYCKTELYETLEAVLAATDIEVVLNGANVDDLGDHRPGMRAAAEHRVVSPLLDAGIHKHEVRELAADWGLPVWNKPASPCLSSRVAYGEEVTEERLRRIDEAEAYLRGLGIVPVRVRYHRGDMARIEAPLDSLARLAAAEVREQLVQRFRELGFQYVSLDLEGFRSGSLNQLIQLGPGKGGSDGRG